MCKLKKLMSINDPNKREIEIRKYAKSLGCSLDSSYSSDGSKHLEEVMVSRIIEAERHQREYSLWIIAFISAVASVLSALAAWAAVLHK